jgi:hypothetical protein
MIHNQKPPPYHRLKPNTTELHTQLNERDSKNLNESSRIKKHPTHWHNVKVILLQINNTTSSKSIENRTFLNQKRKQ